MSPVCFVTEVLSTLRHSALAFKAGQSMSESVSRIRWETGKRHSYVPSQIVREAGVRNLPLEFCVDLGDTGVIADVDRDRNWVGGALQDGAPPLG
jgi:hypothetical protein